ncbi:retrieval of early ER protein Rer1 [Vararia minispora EC-137]|uniref:Retrieval of early ER protein Rer1 n=1 Tax=Vararia minispora EC-137 TaxID=1314806 RepID=A0ACB8QVB7_9AGAM|nr:retrieval of early ER protein Rer1 [Vararia minispora EC-137]
MSASEANGETASPLEQFLAAKTRVQRQYQHHLDRITPFVAERWIGTAVALAVFELRIVFAQGWYIDAHAIYLLNLLLAFLQPRFDPSLQDDIMADELEGGGEDSARSPLPSSRDDEFRPFVRRLPEWQFWLSTTRATTICIFLTFSTIFDVPVYWPILVLYFCVLFVLTMRRQLQHMIKYRYVPWDWGRKTRYGGKQSH